jgi:hypothetical protein
MCSIVGSFNKLKFLELMEQNEFRGSFSYSLTVIDPKSYVSGTVKDFGLFDPEILDKVPEGWYMLGHLQNPTGGLVHDVNRIHPAVRVFDEDYDYDFNHMDPGIISLKLLHNGIIKPATMEMIEGHFEHTYKWDTEALLDFITSYGSEDLETPLSQIDGSFSCALLREGVDLLLFRNSVAPMFYDDHLTISSIPFEDSTSTRYNTIYHMDLLNVRLLPVNTFLNKHMPFYYGEDDE